MNAKMRYVAVTLIAVFSCAAISYTTSAQTDTKTTSVSAPQNPPRNFNEGKLKIFDIKHADAEQLSSTIRPLFVPRPESTTTIVFDQRTNTIIARGAESELELLEVILLRLDEPVAPK